MRVFICSPYGTGDREENIRIARRLTREAIDQGHAPFTPHLLYPTVLDEDKEQERQLGIECALEFVRCCEQMWVYVQSGISLGMVAELIEAMEFIPFYSVTLDPFDPSFVEDPRQWLLDQILQVFRK